ncbi:hypothetical protein C8R43DRAFT_964958 [Mycena crocata]|nr:hypothetical protein C8R43DRAFT_964958 [Mycena crocata]
MAQLHDKLRRLAQAREPILASLQSVSYPVTTLPTEITAEIFLHYVDSAHIGGVGGPIPYAPRLKGGHGPLVLASVCRVWRDVALGLQSIWSCMQIFTDTEFLGATENLLQVWLPRTGTHALDIDIAVSANELMHIVAPYSHQWQAFSCGLSTPAAFTGGELVRGRLPLLRTLELALSVGEEVFEGPLTVFADAPQLRQVHLINYTLFSISLPWAQLTDLKLTGQGTDQCLSILQLTANLEILSVEAHHPLINPILVRLPRLHTLKLRHSPENYDLLRCLTLPALTYLELDHLTYSVIVPVTHFLARSACPLRALTLNFPDETPVLALLRVAPTLRAVRIEEASWSERSFTPLCIALTHEPLFLPNLRSLVLDPCTAAMEIPYTTLADMLAARWQGRGNDSGDGNGAPLEMEEPVARLESFEIVLAPPPGFPPPLDMAGIQRGLDTLRALAADGQKIRIRGLHKISGMVDAEGVRPPLHLYTGE